MGSKSYVFAPNPCEQLSKCEQRAGGNVGSSSRSRRSRSGAGTRQCTGQYGTGGRLLFSRSGIPSSRGLSPCLILPTELQHPLCRRESKSLLQNTAVFLNHRGRQKDKDNPPPSSSMVIICLTPPSAPPLSAIVIFWLPLCK